MGLVRRLRKVCQQRLVDEFHAEARAHFAEVVREGIRTVRRKSAPNATREPAWE
jgi:hypothetical protein